MPTLLGLLGVHRLKFQLPLRHWCHLVQRRLLRRRLWLAAGLETAAGHAPQPAAAAHSAADGPAAAPQHDRC